MSEEPDPPLHPLTPSMEAFPLADEVETLPDEAEVVIAVLRLEAKKLRLANVEMAGKLEEIVKIISQMEHSEYCRGVHGPRGATWFVAKDCDCGIKQILSIINPRERKP